MIFTRTDVALYRELGEDTYELLEDKLALRRRDPKGDYLVEYLRRIFFLSDCRYPLDKWI